MKNVSAMVATSAHLAIDKAVPTYILIWRLPTLRNGANGPASEPGWFYYARPVTSVEEGTAFVTEQEITGGEFCGVYELGASVGLE